MVFTVFHGLDGRYDLKIRIDASSENRDESFLISSASSPSRPEDRSRSAWSSEAVPRDFWRNAPRIKSRNKLDAVLDTSAIICLLEDEPGADLFEQKIAAAEAGDIKIGAIFVSLTELFYITHLSQGKARAEEFVAVFKSWSKPPIAAILPKRRNLKPQISQIRGGKSGFLRCFFCSGGMLLTVSV